MIPTDVRVVAVRTTVDGRAVTVITGTSTGLLRQVNSEFGRHLLLGLPIILVLAAAAVWLVVGRALRPVERIRHAVTDITSADLCRRVPEPGTADEIGHLARTMNDMLARLEEAATQQRRFVADASHELRSPLAAIRTTLEVGLAHPEIAPWPVIAERAAQQAGRLEDLIQQLLLLAKGDEQELAVQQRPVDLGALLSDVVAATPSPGIDIDIDIDAARGTATVGNPEHLQRLFANIVDNALRHAHTRVLIAATTTADEVRIEIDDDGPGIPTADRERVFDRFVRLDHSRERSTGTAGLGLAIAREIAFAHSGHIAIGGSSAGGTRMIVTLPLAPRSPQATQH
ncbi:MAG: HAMP domain-containing histidine kinase [Actinomycetota bacterium]|nr:HAMP domain-containing histidine kinase [Actinomycetota bacterium]